MIDIPFNGSCKARYNAVLDLSFDEGSITEPVTKDEVKAYCKLNSGTAEDSILDRLITSAREQCEEYAGISFIVRGITATVTNLDGGIFLPYGPVTLPITSIKDQYGDDIENYKISGTQFPQLIYPHDQRIELVYDAGYQDLPQQLKLAILQQVFYLYQNRGEISEVTRSGVPTETSVRHQAKAPLKRLWRVGL